MPRILAASLLLAALAGVAAAKPVAFSATGVFTGADGSLDPTMVGQSFRLDVAYESDALPAGGYGFGSTSVSYYDLTSLGLTLGGTTYQFDTMPQATVVESETDSEIRFDGMRYPGGGDEGQTFSLRFAPASPLTTTALPRDVDALGVVTVAEYRAISGFGEYSVDGRAYAGGVSVQAVPEPASLAGLGLGALGLLRRARRGRRA